MGLNRSMAPHCQFSQKNYHSQMYVITSREKECADKARYSDCQLHRHGTVYGDRSDKTASNMQLILGTKFLKIGSFLGPAADLRFPCTKVFSLLSHLPPQQGGRSGAKARGLLASLLQGPSGPGALGGPSGLHRLPSSAEEVVNNSCQRTPVYGVTESHSHL